MDEKTVIGCEVWGSLSWFPSFSRDGVIIFMGTQLGSLRACRSDHLRHNIRRTWISVPFLAGYQ
jgi:hypothetical protein